MIDDKFRRAGDAASRVTELLEGKKPLAAAEDDELLDAEELEPEAFKTVSADRMQKIMLVFWLIKGNATAKAYSYLTGIEFNPSNGIILSFVDSEVRIKGFNLRPLFLALTAHRVQSIQESDELYAEASGAAAGTVVTRIEVVAKP